MSFSSRQIREEKPRKKWPWDKLLVSALKAARPVLAMYHDWKEEREREERHEHNIMLLKRVLLVLVAILFAFGVLAGLAKAITGVRLFSLDTFVSVTAADLPVDENGYTNLLLLGQGDESHDGKDLTDTIIVASIDPETQSVVMLSFPRDLYFLHTEQMGVGRLNSLYRDYKGYLDYNKDMDEQTASMEALKELQKEMSDTIGLTLHHTIKVDFKAVIETVDALGGVTVDVPYDIVDTEYPDENYGYQTFEIYAGPQTLDGETALKYARSRHTTSDFGRSARQQQLIMAMAEKAKEKGILSDAGTITKLMTAIIHNMETTLGTREMIGLAQMAKDIDRSRIITMQLNDRNGLYGGFVEPGGFLYNPPRNLFEGASVLLPVSIPEYPVTWRQIRTLTKLLFTQRKVYLSKPVVNVLNAGGPSGMARVLATELIRYGFEVDEIANASIDKQDASYILPRSEADAAFATFFGAMLGLSTDSAPFTLPPDEQGQITIVLGRDYSYTPLQNAFPELQ